MLFVEEDFEPRGENDILQRLASQRENGEFVTLTGDKIEVEPTEEPRKYVVNGIEGAEYHIVGEGNGLMKIPLSSEVPLIFPRSGSEKLTLALRDKTIEENAAKIGVDEIFRLRDESINRGNAVEDPSQTEQTVVISKKGQSNWGDLEVIEVVGDAFIVGKRIDVTEIKANDEVKAESANGNVQFVFTFHPKGT